MRVSDSFGFVDSVAQKRFDCGAEEHCPSAQREILCRLKIFENGQLFESSLLTEVDHKGVESAFLSGIQFRSSIRGEQFIHTDFCASEGIQGTGGFPGTSGVAVNDT